MTQFENYETKPALKSKGIWGNIISFGAGAAIFIGQSIAENPEVLAAVIAPKFLPIAVMIGSALGLYGRAKADKKIEGIVE